MGRLWSRRKNNGRRIRSFVLFRYRLYSASRSNGSPMPHSVLALICRRDSLYQSERRTVTAAILCGCGQLCAHTVFGGLSNTLYVVRLRLGQTKITATRHPQYQTFTPQNATLYQSHVCAHQHLFFAQHHQWIELQSF